MLEPAIIPMEAPPPPPATGPASGHKRRCSLEADEAGYPSSPSGTLVPKRARKPLGQDEAPLPGLQYRDAAGVAGYDLMVVLPAFQRFQGRLLKEEQQPEACALLRSGKLVTLVRSREIDLPPAADGNAASVLVHICRVFLRPAEVTLSVTTSERCLFLGNQVRD
jgi:hypothetical protein